MAKRKATKDERAERISKICETINSSDFGGDNKDAVTWLGSRDTISVERFSSGCSDFDDALGGGWPKGRMVEIYGPESGGKTTLALEATAQHQIAYPDEDCGLIDAEYSFDEDYATAVGVDTKYLMVNQPDSGEQALNVMSMMMRLGIKLIIVDSVAALTPKSELEGAVGDGSGMAEQARIMSMALRRLTTEAGSHGVTVIWTNQLREKIGVMFGDKTTTPAGRALKHYASIRVNVKRIKTIKKGPEGAQIAVSSLTRADVKKNKVAPPFRKAEFYITYGIGIDIPASILDGALKYDLVKKRGSWFSFDGEQIAQGREGSLDKLRIDSELLERIKKATEEAKEVAKEGTQSEPSKSTLDIKRPSVERQPVSDDPDAIDTESTEVEVTDV